MERQYGEKENYCLCNSGMKLRSCKGDFQSQFPGHLIDPDLFSMPVIIVVQIKFISLYISADSNVPTSPAPQLLGIFSILLGIFCAYQKDL